jgi:Ala-tRNA(Pro) deacylase
MSVPPILTDRCIPHQVLVHPPAFTAQKRAKYLHVPGREVAKCVLLKGPSGYVLAVLPATRHINTARLGAVVGGDVRLASEPEIADVFRDCEWGVVAPFGTRYGLQTFLDDSLAPDAWVIFELSSHTEAVRLRCRDFEELERPQRLRFAD